LNCSFSSLNPFFSIELGTLGVNFLKEKFTKVDHEKHLKELEAMGFTLYRVHFEIIENGDNSCIIKSTIEYGVKEEATANASFVTIEPLTKVALLAKAYLIKNKAA
jgi:hypothetical protein